jgi:hypothetical protein
VFISLARSGSPCGAPGDRSMPLQRLKNVSVLTCLNSFGSTLQRPRHIPAPRPGHRPYPCLAAPRRAARLWVRGKADKHPLAPEFARHPARPSLRQRQGPVRPATARQGSAKRTGSACRVGAAKPGQGRQHVGQVPRQRPAKAGPRQQKAAHDRRTGGWQPRPSPAKSVKAEQFEGFERNPLVWGHYGPGDGIVNYR